MATERQIQANRRMRPSIYYRAERSRLAARDRRLALAPVGALENLLAEKIVSDAWRMRRVPMLEAAVHARAKHERVVENLTREVEECENTTSVGVFLKNMNRARDPREARTRLQAAISELEGQPLLQVSGVLQQYEPELLNLTRHEESLLRSMLKTLHELQRLQAERAGKDVPPPAALDINIDVNPGRGLVPDSEPMVPDRAQDKANS